MQLQATFFEMRQTVDEQVSPITLDSLCFVLAESGLASDCGYGCPHGDLRAGSWRHRSRVIRAEFPRTGVATSTATSVKLGGSNLSDTSF